MVEIDIPYSDKHLLIVNKPAGLLSVPGRGPDKKDCVLRRAQCSFPTARIVHRLDCATSGAMVLALDAETHRALSRQFHDREVQKRYIAWVSGVPQQASGDVREPLMTDWPNRPRQKVDPAGKSAHTRYLTLRIEEDRARMQLTPVTGRSHQLRVHMQTLGHPILGDEFYGDARSRSASDRLMLHAEYLAFKHPASHQHMEFELHAPF